jgi:hypothetical protein
MGCSLLPFGAAACSSRPKLCICQLASRERQMAAKPESQQLPELFVGTGGRPSFWVRERQVGIVFFFSRPRSKITRSFSADGAIASSRNGPRSTFYRIFTRTQPRPRWRSPRTCSSMCSSNTHCPSAAVLIQARNSSTFVSSKQVRAWHSPAGPMSVDARTFYTPDRRNCTFLELHVIIFPAMNVNSPFSWKDVHDKQTPPPLWCRITLR